MALPSVGSIIDFVTGGSGSSTGTGGTATPAYKGDGLSGMGTFLTGVANAYRKDHTRDTGTTQRLKGEMRSIFDDYTKELKSKYSSRAYDKCAALQDSSRVLEGIFYEYRREIPKILSTQCAAGIYDSTATQQMLNDAYARNVSIGAKLSLETIQNYRRLELEGDNVILGAMARQIESYTEVDNTREFETSPDMEEFAKDAAVAALALGILQLFTMRKYNVDDSTSGSIGGIG